MALSRRKRLTHSLLLFAFMALFIAASIFLPTRFITQDGPNHLYNAYLFNKLLSIPSVNYNLIIQYSPLLLNFLLTSLFYFIFGEYFTEKVFILLYVIIFLFSKLTLLKILSTSTTPPYLGFLFPTFVSLLLAFNATLHLGFFAFCLSLSLALLGITFWIQKKHSKGSLVFTLSTFWHPVNALLIYSFLISYFVIFKAYKSPTKTLIRTWLPTTMILANPIISIIQESSLNVERLPNETLSQKVGNLLYGIPLLTAYFPINQMAIFVFGFYTFVLIGLILIDWRTKSPLLQVFSLTFTLLLSIYLIIPEQFLTVSFLNLRLALYLYIIAWIIIPHVELPKYLVFFTKTLLFMVAILCLPTVLVNQIYLNSLYNSHTKELKKLLTGTEYYYEGNEASDHDIAEINTLFGPFRWRVMPHLHWHFYSALNLKHEVINNFQVEKFPFIHPSPLLKEKLQNIRSALQNKKALFLLPNFYVINYGFKEGVKVISSSKIFTFKKP